MSFRKYGGVNYAATNNYVRNTYTNSTNLTVMNKVGQPDSAIVFDSDVIVNANLYVVNNLDVSGSINVEGNLDVSGIILLNGNLDVSGNILLNGNLDVSCISVSDAATFYSSLTVNGTSYLNSLNVPTYTNLSSLTVSDDATFYSSLTVNGTSYLESLAVNTYTNLSSLTVSDDATFYSTINQSITFNGSSDLQSATFGTNALTSINSTDAVYNAAFGYQALQNNQSGSKNVGVGYQSLQQNQAGTANTSVGYQALQNNISTTGRNTAIGTNAGTNDTNGSYNTYLGGSTGVAINVTSETLQYSTAIGYGSVIDASNQLVLGGNNNGIYTSVAVPGTLSVQGVSNFNSTLTCYGDIYANNYYNNSDYRIKYNVEPLDISKYNVDNLKPISYINKQTNKQDVGLLAHELQEILPFLVEGEKDGDDLQKVNYLGLISILIKEIQELKSKMK